MPQSNDLYLQMILMTVRAKKYLCVLSEAKKLTPVQSILLIVLIPGETKSMNELSEIMGCDASNITGLVDRLESHELIERSSSDKDRRIKHIRLTDIGIKFRQHLVDGLKKSELLDLSKLSESEEVELNRLVYKILN